MASASIDAYLVPWAERVGFHTVVATKLEVAPDGRLTGRFDGEACWGRAKLRRVEQAVGPLSDHYVMAYGDSRGDEPLLSAANRGWRIRGPASWDRID